MVHSKFQMSTLKYYNNVKKQKFLQRIPHLNLKMSKLKPPIEMQLHKEWDTTLEESKKKDTETHVSKLLRYHWTSWEITHVQLVTMKLGIEREQLLYQYSLFWVSFISMETCSQLKMDKAIGHRLKLLLVQHRLFLGLLLVLSLDLKQRYQKHLQHF